MAQKTIQGSVALGKQIKTRRNELGLTIEESAYRAGVGTKTWSRYEAGESIRKDKYKGICKALNWTFVPCQDEKEKDGIPIEEYKEHEAWSEFLREKFGDEAAMAFAIGSDILLDHIKDDLSELSTMSAGSHLGQLSMSWLLSDLPEQFLTNYDYDFLYLLKCTLCKMRARANCGASMVAHSVIEELLLYLCNEESIAFIDIDRGYSKSDNEENIYAKKWIFDLLDGIDIIAFLYSDVYLPPDHPYHFSHWNDQQFYI